MIKLFVCLIFCLFCFSFLCFVEMTASCENVIPYSEITKAEDDNIKKLLLGLSSPNQYQYVSLTNQKIESNMLRDDLKTLDNKSSQVKNNDTFYIPEQAHSTGDLSFLAGCWEGMRPHFTYRILMRECFCFDKDGDVGTRYVFKDMYQCSSSSQSFFQKNGDLVIKGSAREWACTDNEDLAESWLICRNIGQNAPCTWHFTLDDDDLNYVMHLKRVESCKQ